MLTRAREVETKYVREQNELEIAKAREMVNLETEKFNNIVQAIGPDTISAIAPSRPEMQVCIVCMFVCVCLCVCARACVYVCLSVCPSVFVGLCVCVCICLHLHMGGLYVNVYTSMYMCIY